MKNTIIKEEAKSLVDLTIKLHKTNQLGKEKLSKFIKNNITKELEEEDYNKLLHYYNRYLSEEEYEIKQNIKKFDIIDYTSEEYHNYISNIKKL